MIGFAESLLVEHVLAPQDDAARGELRVYLDPESRPIDTEAQEINVLPLTTVPVGYEIGGGVQIRHTISVLLSVQHGDVLEAGRLRNAIALELVLRTAAAKGAIESAVDLDTGEIVDAVSWSIDWRPYAQLVGADTTEAATFTFTFDTTLDP